jgi:hypothetical protein
MAVPTRDSALATFAPNFATILSGSPTTYNVTAAQCTTLTTASTNFVTAYNACRAEGMRSKSLTAAKEAAKAALLLPLLRPMYAQVAALTSVTDAQKIALGITVRRHPAPQPAPSTAPAVNVVFVRGRTVRLRLRDAASTTRRGKPVGVASATILSYVGTTPPADLAGWRFEANVTHTLVDVSFAAATAPGAQVWFTVFWSNRKDQPGPACDPVGTYLQPGSVSALPEAA